MASSDLCALSSVCFTTFMTSQGARCLNEIACLHEGVQQYQPQLPSERPLFKASQVMILALFWPEDYPVLPGRGGEVPRHYHVSEFQRFSAWVQKSEFSATSAHGRIQQLPENINEALQSSSR